MYSTLKVLYLLQFVLGGINGDIELNCGTVNTFAPANVTCSCTFPGKGISWFYPNGTKLVNCFHSVQCSPEINGFIFTIDVSEFLYRMTIFNYRYNDCIFFTCKDVINNTVQTSARPLPSKFDSTTPVTLNEPISSYSNGIINITIACVFEYWKLKHTWYIVSDDSEIEYTIDHGRSIFDVDNTSCHECYGDFLASLTIGFEHKEATDVGAQKILFKVKLFHENYTDVINLTSSHMYTVQGNGTNGSENNSKIILAIITCVVLVFLIVMAIFVYCLMKIRIKDTVATETTIRLKDTKPMLTFGRTDKKYNVVCEMAKKDGECDPVVTLGSKDISIRNLKPLTEYKIIVSSKYCCTYLSTEKTVRTKEGSKPDPPIMLKESASDITETSINVKWKPGYNGGLEQTFCVCFEDKEHQVNPSNTDGELFWYGFDSLKPGLSYKIQVTAKNEKGVVLGEKRCIKTLCSKPDPPIMLKESVGDIKETSIKVKWKPGYNGGLEQTFCVCFEDKEHQVNPSNTDGELFWYGFDSLKPGVSYTVQVKAKNEKGVVLGEKCCIKTLCSKPDQPIMLKESVVEITETSINVKWKPGYNGGLEQTFCVCFEDKEHQVNPSNTDGELFWYGFDSLKPGVSYTVQVKAKNEKGMVLGEKRCIKTLCSKPDPPKMLKESVGDITETSIKVKWKPGYNGGLEQTFCVCFEDKEHQVNPSNTDGELFWYGFDSLKPGVSYTVQVKAKNEKGVVLGEKCCIKTLCSKPDQPIMLKESVGDITETSINVKWKPGYNGGLEQTFCVCFEDKEHQVNPSNTDGELFWYGFDSLKPGVSYTVQVKAKNKKGTVLGEKRCIKTLCSKPDQPIMLKESLGDITETSIKVKWKPGYNGGLEQTFCVCFEDKEHQVNPSNTDGELFWYGFDSLRPGLSYTVQVKAKNKKGMVLGGKLCIKTLCSKPDPPIMLKESVSDITETSIKVKWKPGYNGGLEQTFCVCFEDKEHQVNPSNTDGELFWYEFDSLKPGLSYTVQVKAKNKKGWVLGDKCFIKTVAKPE